MATVPSANNRVQLRLRLPSRPGMLGRVAMVIGEAGGDIGDVVVLDETREYTVRDIAVDACSLQHEKVIADAVRAIEGVEVLTVADQTFALHDGGKIEVTCKMPLATRADLSMAYTPGVARVCMAVHDDPLRAYSLTIKRNTVAVVSDGTAVLGLGDIGPEAAMPVMEGKAMLFKTFGGVDAFPLCLNTKDPEEIIATVKAVAPTFGGINLEDISAPRCFEIEDRLKAELDIPVFHDDQHGTAVVVLAALINALKLVQKPVESLKVVVSGVGAAGVACSKILMAAGVQNIIGCDRSGAIYRGRTENMNVMKDWYAEHTNPAGERGSIHEVIAGADLFLGLSGPGTITVDDVRRMADRPIVFAMANPVPEIMPEEAGPYVAVMATGRSDYPNQINNVLAFPGIFRGALDCRATGISEGMKLAAARALADTVSEAELRPEYIIPSAFNPAVAPAVAEAVMQTAIEEGLARITGGEVPEFDAMTR